MKKIGFIVEGDSEKIILDSVGFISTLQNLDLTCIGIFNINGRDNFWGTNNKLKSFVEILIDNGAEEIFFLLDLETDRCFSQVKGRIEQHFDHQTVIIAKKTIEAWFLADSSTLSEIIGSDYQCQDPENTEENPFEVLRKIFVDHNCTHGIGKSKTKCANKFISKGFSIEAASEHENCKSAKYFLEKLKK